MNEWMEPFLRECLAKITYSPYKAQVRKELTDHLKSAAEALEKSGCDPQQARQLALSRMGDPAALSQTFLEESRRREAVDPLWCVNVIWTGCFLAGFVYFFAVFPVGLLVGYRNLGPILPLYRLSGGELLWHGAFGCGMFLLPFGIAARYMTRALRLHPRRELVVTCGLWIAWAVEKLAGFLLGRAIYGFWEMPALVERISGGGDGFAPWFTIPYILLTFIGCPILAFVVSRLESSPKYRSERLA